MARAFLIFGLMFASLSTSTLAQSLPLMREDCVTKSPRFFFGGKIRPVKTPQTMQEWVAWSRTALSANTQAPRIHETSLKLRSFRHLPLSQIGSSDKIAVTFEQRVNDIPVIPGDVCVLLDADDGAVLAIDYQGVEDAEAASSEGALSQFEMIEIARRAFAEKFHAPAVLLESPQLIIVGPSFLWGARGPTVPTLAYWLSLDAPGRKSPEGLPLQAEAIVSASGNILLLELTTRSSVGGTVKGNVNLGPEPNDTFLGNSNHEQAPLAHMYVRQNNISGPLLATTDSSGNFSIPQSGPLSLFFELRGPWANVNDLSAADASIALTGDENSPANPIFNTGPGPTYNPDLIQFESAQVAAFYWANRFHDYVKSTDPAENEMDFPIILRTNSPGFCSAFWNFTYTEFYTETFPYCSNAAYRSIVHHEIGHWANHRFNATGPGAGGVSNAFHEGAADAWAYYVGDDPCFGLDFWSFAPGCNRSGEQVALKKCPGDCMEDCHGDEPHTAGEALGSALWKVRRNLKSSLGTVAGSQTADSLFLSWFQAFNDKKICNVILDHWLALDDDDGDLSNLTPNFAAIYGAFLEQGWPTIDTGLQISLLEAPAFGASILDANPVTIRVVTASQFNSPTTVDLFFSLDDGANYSAVPMTLLANGEFAGEIPGFATPQRVRWYLEAKETLTLGTKRLPALAPESFEMYFTASEVIVLGSYSFEGNSDEGWTHGVFGGNDDWQRETTQGGMDPTQAYSGSKVWGTSLSPSWAFEQQGTRFLQTPVFPTQPFSSYRLQYRRWLTVNQSPSHQAWIDANGISIWSNPTNATPFIDTDWIPQDLDLTLAVGSQKNFQVGWNLSVMSSTTPYGGWNLDDVSILRIRPYADLRISASSPLVIGSQSGQVELVFRVENRGLIDVPALLISGTLPQGLIPIEIGVGAGSVSGEESWNWSMPGLAAGASTEMRMTFLASQIPANASSAATLSSAYPEFDLGDNSVNAAMTLPDSGGGSGTGESNLGGGGSGGGGGGGCACGGTINGQGPGIDLGFWGGLGILLAVALYRRRSSGPIQAAATR